jgi:hypothetical protein
MNLPKILSAQFFEDLSPQALSNEPPLTQKDIDFAIQYFYLIGEYNTSKNEAEKNEVFGSISNFLTDSGYSQERINIAIFKTIKIISFIYDNISLEKANEYSKITLEEIELVDRNLSELQKAINFAFPHM